MNLDLTTLMFLTGATGFFASRAFIPAFFTAVYIRFGDLIPFSSLGDQPFIEVTGAEPTWFTSNLAIGVLGLLAALELAASKSAAAQELLEDAMKYGKSAMAALTTLGVLGARDAAFVGESLQQAGVLDLGFAGLVAVAVQALGTLRGGAMDLLIQGDPDDDFGIRKLISWFEDVWAAFGLYLLIIYPLLIIAILALLSGAFYAIRKLAERREERAKIPCPACETLVYGCAPHCPSCKAVMPSPRDVGLLGTTIERPAKPITEHRFRLLSKRRCTQCAERLPERLLPQPCPACNTRILGNVEDQSAYCERIRGRLPKVLGITFILSLIPILGVIPGIIYYRIQLVAPFRMFIPVYRGVLLKWLVRLVFILLISLQLIPGLGGFMVPIMALLSYSLYSNAFKNTLAEHSSAQP